MSYSSPVDPSLSRVASGYGVRPGRRTGAPTYHAGADFVGHVGDPVFAVADGVVEHVITDDRPRGTRGYGNVAVIHHPMDNDVRSMYAHLAKFYHLEEGQQIRAGDFVGAVGRTTNGRFPGMGAHLHFEIRTPTRSGRPPIPGPYRVNNVDPLMWLAERGVLAEGWRDGDRLQDQWCFNPHYARDPSLRLGRYFESPAEVGIYQDEMEAACGYSARIEPSPLRSERGVLRGLNGLGDAQSEAAFLAQLDMGAEGLPAEPIRDPWTFIDPPSGASVVLVTVSGLVAVAGVGATMLAVLKG